MVEEEVHHLARVGKHGEGPESGGGPGVAPQGVEAGEEPARSEGLAAEARRDFPLLGTVGGVGVLGLDVPVD